MEKHWKLAATALFAASLTACAVTFTPAPGSERVKVTAKPTDVQSCKAVGNLDKDKYAGDEAAMRNAVVGDGGDTLLLTAVQGGVALAGIAYRCGPG